MRLYLTAAAALLLQRTAALNFLLKEPKAAPPPAPAPPPPFSLFGPTIRKAQIADLEPLAETRLQASPFAAGYAIASRKEAGEKLSDLFCRGIEKGDTVCYLAVENDNIIGSCDVTVRKRLGRGLPKHAYLKNLFVDEGYRRRGIGGKLVQACAEEARRWDVCTLALEVENENENAARLYERLGFVAKKQSWCKECLDCCCFSVFFGSKGYDMMYKQLPDVAPGS